MRSKPKSIAPCTRDFSRALSKLLLIARNSDWFIALFTPVVIGRSNYYCFGLSTIIWKPLYLKPTYPHFALNLMPSLFSLCRWGLASGMNSTPALLKKTREIFQKGVSNKTNRYASPCSYMRLLPLAPSFIQSTSNLSVLGSQDASRLYHPLLDGRSRMKFRGNKSFQG